MNVVVTGGGTIGPIDDVRAVTNASTGRFSAEITEACLRRNARVWHVHAPSALLPFSRSASFDLGTDDPNREFARLEALRRNYRLVADRLHLRPFSGGTVAAYRNVLRTVLETEAIDVAFLAAAVSDFEPLATSGKIDSDRSGLILNLEPSPKVIRSVRDWSPGSYLVGFKLLSGSRPEVLIARASEANTRNRADLTVANDMTSLRSGRHTIYLVRANWPVETLGPGGAIAEGLVERVFAWASRSRRVESVERASKRED